MESLRSRVDNLDLTVDFGDLIEQEKVVSNIAIDAQLLSKKPINLDALLRVHRKIFTRNDGLDSGSVYFCVLL